MAEAHPAKIEPDREGPLSGIRVLDLSRVVAGNALGLELADFGAEVIKIEPPGGDPLRDWQVKGHSLYWKELSRNKLSVVLDLRKPEGMAALERLIPTADVMIENFRPGVLEEMGLAPDRLLAMAPDLILVRISGFGQTGPASRLPGFGTLVEAMSGFASRNGFADREPVLPPLALADMIAGLHGAKAVLAALRARDRGMASCCWSAAMPWRGTRATPPMPTGCATGWRWTPSSATGSAPATATRRCRSSGPRASPSARCTTSPTSWTTTM